MEVGDKEKKEIERKKLKDLNLALLKVSEDIEREEERIEEIQNLKTVKELKEVEASLYRKINEIQAEIEATEASVKVKMDELKWLNEGREERDVAFYEQLDIYWKNYFETVSELEAEVKREYLEYQNDRDTKMLLKTVLEKLNEDNKRPVLVEIFRKKKEYALKREEDLNKAKEKLEEEVNSMSEEIEKLKAKIALFEQKYQSQYDMYVMSMKAKKAQEY